MLYISAAAQMTGAIARLEQSASIMARHWGVQAAQGLYEITLREEFSKMNELTGSIMLSLGIRPGYLIKAW
jgi:hypothetical protein